MNIISQNDYLDVQETQLTGWIWIQPSVAYKIHIWIVRENRLKY